MKSLINYILENKQNNLFKFKHALEQIVHALFHNIDPIEKGRMISMIEIEDYERLRDTKIKDLCDEYMVFIASEDRDDAPPKYIRVMFESAYGENITKEIYNRDHVRLFHLTDQEYVETIMKNGLQLKKAVKSFKMKQYHPARIYVLDGEITQSKFKQYAGQLGSTDVIIIDLSMLNNEYNEKIDLFKDPQSAERVSMYTDTFIRKEVLEHMTLKEFYKSDIFLNLRK